MSDKKKKSRENRPEANGVCGSADAADQPEAQGAQEGQAVDAPRCEESDQQALNEGDAAKNAPQEADTSDPKESPESRIAELEAQCAEYKDLYVRKAADFENYRKRMIKEKQEAIDYANTGLLVDLVQVLDDFDRAIAAAEKAEEGSAASAFIEGVAMIRKQMASMLESKYGLVYYPSQEGEPFDPNIHEAIGRVPAEDATEPVVQTECRKGYKLKDRVIRVAQVIVKTPPEN